MTIQTYLASMLAPDEHYHFLPTGELFATPETLKLIRDYRDWFTVLREAGYYEDLDYC